MKEQELIFISQNQSIYIYIYIYGQRYYTNTYLYIDVIDVKLSYD